MGLWPDLNIEGLVEKQTAPFVAKLDQLIELLKETNRLLTDIEANTRTYE